MPVTGRMRTNNQEALFEAVLAGAGLALLPDWLVEPHISAGLLQRVRGELEGPSTPVHAEFQTPGSPPRIVRTFVYWLADGFRWKPILAACN